MLEQGEQHNGVNLTLKGTELYAQGPLTAGALRQLARWATNVGPIMINGQDLTADELNRLAIQSEHSGQPIYFERGS